MDFKIAGTRVGITAIQLDIKPCGIPLEILCEALEPARIAREHILDAMEQGIQKPTSEQKSNAPHKGCFSIQRESVGRLIGPQGSTVKNIERTTGVRVTISEGGRVCLIAKDKVSYDQAIEMVDSAVGKEIEIGNIYNGFVTQIRDFGAIVEVDGGHEGLLHISELSHQRVAHVTDAVMLGQKLSVMCIGRDAKGNLKLSLKATMPMSTAGNYRESSPMVKVVEHSITTASIANATAATKIECEVIKSKVVPEQSVRVPLAFEETETVSQKQGHVKLEHQKSAPVRVPLAFEETETVSQKQGHVKLEHQKSAPVGVPLAFEETETVSQKQGHVKLEHQKSAELHEVSPRAAVSTLEGNKEAKLESKRSDDVMIDSSKKIQVNVGGEYEATVHQVRQMGAVLKLHNGELGKLFFDKETVKSSFSSGSQLIVRCVNIDHRGKPVFSLLKFLSS
ncbi:hypothetical protein L7F22_004534 [Adiantum nelumboides]|nr:hypothetical protein [Adiantum nelumboides]